MGVTFKEDVGDIRNSKVFDLIQELMDYSVHVDVVDPRASDKEVWQKYQIRLADRPTHRYDGIVIAVGHAEYKNMTEDDFRQFSESDTIVADLKGIRYPLQANHYWRM
jgi:UDP-N-acetyl-D-galactosamine dehydrogenase